MKFIQDNLIWIAPTAAVFGSALTLAAVGVFGGAADEQPANVAGASDPLAGFTALVQAPDVPQTVPSNQVNGQDIVSQLQRATANAGDAEVTRDAPISLLDTTSIIAPLAEPAAAPAPVETAEPDIAPVSEPVQTSASAADFFATAQANLAADNPCGDDLKALVQDANIYFPSGGVTAEASGLVKARVIGKIAEECPNYTLQVRGHSDPSGDSALNLALSEKRAKALMNLLASSGINTRDFIAVGMGDREPSNVEGPLGSAYYDRRVDFQVVESVKTASAAGFVQQPWSAAPAAASACAADLKVRAEQTRLFYNTRSITVSPSDLAPVYELAEAVGACEGARLRVMGHHSDMNGANESLKTGRLRALVLMGSLVAAGFEGERILVGAPSHSVGVVNQPTLPRSRVDFQIIMD